MLKRFYPSNSVKEITSKKSINSFLKIGIGSAYLSFYACCAIFSLFWIGVIVAGTYGSDFNIYFQALTNAIDKENPYLPYSIGISFINHPTVLTILRFFFFEGHRFRSLLFWSGVSVTAWGGALLITNVSLSNIDKSRSDQLSRNRLSIILIVLFMMFGPFLETLFVGQINTFALLFLYASFFFAERDQDSLAGCSLGLAVIFKTSPLIFIIYFLLLRRYKIAIVSVVFIALASLYTAIQFRSGIVYDFLLIVPKLSNEIHINVFNESLISAVYTLFPSLNQGIIGKGIPILHKALLATIILIIAYLVLRNGVLSKEQKFWLFNVFIVLMVIFSPLVWYHHSVFFLLPIAALLVINEHWFFRISGLFALTLIQIVRPFEHYIIRFPWPILMAQILLLVVTLIVLLRKFGLLTLRQNNNVANR